MAFQSYFPACIVANKLQPRLDSTHAFAREIWKVSEFFPVAKIKPVRGSVIGAVLAAFSDN